MYQVIVASDLATGTLKQLAGSKAIILDEETGNAWDPSNPTALKRFSIYRKTINSNNKPVLIKHSGALPIVSSKIRHLTVKTCNPGEPQYIQLSGTDDCLCGCKEYTISFRLHNDEIQKTQFPNEIVEEYSVKKKCCESGCGDENPYTWNELIVALWREVAHNESYVVPQIIGEGIKNYRKEVSGDVTSTYLLSDPTVNGELDPAANTGDIVKYNNSYYEWDGTKWASTTPSTTDIIYANGKDIYLAEDETTTVDKVTDSVMDSIVTAFNKLGTTLNLVFAVVPSPEYYYGQINFRYEHLRNTIAKFEMFDGFKCSSCITSVDNMKDANDIFHANAKDSIGDTAIAAQVFSQPQGMPYDVKQLEFEWAMETYQSPYPTSPNTFSENGQRYQVDEVKADSYACLVIEYQQPSEGITRLEHHPHGTMLFIDCNNKDVLYTIVAKIIEGGYDGPVDGDYKA